MDSGRVQREESIVRRPEEGKKERTKKQMTAEEFMGLSSSEQLRARREGKF